MPTILEVRELDDATSRHSDDRGTVERTQGYVVLCDGWLGRAADLAIGRHPLIPRRRQLHPAGDCYANGFTSREREGYTTPTSAIYDVEATWTSRLQEIEEEPDPLARAAKVGMRTEKRTVTRYVDADGKPLRNTAGDLLVDTVEESNWVFTVRKNLTAIPDWLDDYRDAINDADIRLRGRTRRKGTLKVEAVTFPETEQHEVVSGVAVPYVPITIELKHDPRGWNEPLLNRGFNELTLPGGFVGPANSMFGGITTSGGIVSQFPELFAAQLVPILVGDPAEPPTEPLWLDAEGHAFRTEPDEQGRQKIRQPEPEEIVLVKNKRYRELPFSKLPLT